MYTKKELARKIKQSLGLRGISYTSVGKLLNINQSTVSNWCSGYSIPNQVHQKKLLALLENADKEAPENGLPLLSHHDFGLYNRAFLTLQQNRIRQNRSNYNNSKKDEEKA